MTKRNRNNRRNTSRNNRAKSNKSTASKPSANKKLSEHKKPSANKKSSGNNKPSKYKTPSASGKPSGVTIIKNVQVDDSGVPVQIKDHMDNMGGHPHAIMDNVDDCHVSVGLSTHAKKGRNHPNRTMDKSPLGDGKQSYMRRQACVYPIDEYVNPRCGAMSQSDYDYAKQAAEKAKQKYLEQKNKKDKKK